LCVQNKWSYPEFYRSPHFVTTNAAKPLQCSKYLKSTSQHLEITMNSSQFAHYPHATQNFEKSPKTTLQSPGDVTKANSKI